MVDRAHLVSRIALYRYTNRMGAARQDQLAIRQGLLFRPLLSGQLLRLGVYPKDLGVRVQFHL